MKRILLLGVVVCLAMGTQAQAKKEKHTGHGHTTTTTGTKTLAERLGGYKAISAVVDEFVANVGADQRINSFFANTNLDNLKKQLKDQICAAAGGFYDTTNKKPCKYTGKDMKTAHMGMGVQDAHFGALVEDLVKALDKFKVPEKEKGELLAVLGPMKKDIVETKSAATQD